MPISILRPCWICSSTTLQERPQRCICCNTHRYSITCGQVDGRANHLVVVGGTILIVALRCRRMHHHSIPSQMQNESKAHILLSPSDDRNGYKSWAGGLRVIGSGVVGEQLGSLKLMPWKSSLQVLCRTLFPNLYVSTFALFDTLSFPIFFWSLLISLT